MRVLSPIAHAPLIQATEHACVPRVRLAELDPGLALLPLRLFLGVTFVYGGVQKLSDPGFFHPGAPSYIGTQLSDFAAGTPGGFVLRDLALPHAELAGAGVAIAEIAIGVLVIVGLLTRWAAAAGLGLNLLLFLTASWKTYPYFLGSDIVFVFAWLPFVLAGARGQPALDHSLEQHARAPRRGESLSRRAFLGRAVGATGAAVLSIAGIATLLRGDYTGAAPKNLANSTTPAGRRRRHRRATHRHRHERASLPAGAIPIAASTALAPGQSGTYRDPANGQPDLVIRQSNGSLSAMSAICTHAGCQCVYAQAAVQCPCHGSVFDAKTGAVIQGPAVQALPLRKVVEHEGKIYAVPA